MTPAGGVQVVWFRRDLRVHDHAPLHQAARRGPVLPLYVVEPAIIGAADFSPRHWTGLRAALEDLRAALGRLGQPLVVRFGDAADVLGRLGGTWPIAAVWSHAETGTAAAAARDRAVQDWARTAGVPWHVLPQPGVVRGAGDGERHPDAWLLDLSQPLAPAPAALPPLPPGADGRPIEIGAIPDHALLGLGPDDRVEIDPAGEAAGLVVLDDFLRHRGARYHLDAASPVTAWSGSSRLSVHLAHGTLSPRRVHQAAHARLAAVRAGGRAARGEDGGDWLHALSAFGGRIEQRCHCIQAFEDTPAIETRNWEPAYDGLREDAFDAERFAAWCAGRTGYPLVDAAMRALGGAGWLNFRMRAMLVSFAAHDLWLHWREPALHLARLFADYEPGIHYPQVQLQAGTGGRAGPRIYNPTLQARTQDPDGLFIRRWVPELEGVPDAYLHAPWLMPAHVQLRARCAIGRDYPAPIVDHDAAARAARARLARVVHAPPADGAPPTVIRRPSRHAPPGERGTARPRRPPPGHASPEAEQPRLGGL